MIKISADKKKTGHIMQTKGRAGVQIKIDDALHLCLKLQKSRIMHSIRRCWYWPGFHSISRSETGRKTKFRGKPMIRQLLKDQGTRKEAIVFVAAPTVDTAKSRFWSGGPEEQYPHFPSNHRRIRQKVSYQKSSNIYLFISFLLAIS